MTLPRRTAGNARICFRAVGCKKHGKFRYIHIQGLFADKILTGEVWKIHPARDHSSCCFGGRTDGAAPKAASVGQTSVVQQLFGDEDDGGAGGLSVRQIAPKASKQRQK